MRNIHIFSRNGYCNTLFQVCLVESAKRVNISCGVHADVCSEKLMITEATATTDAAAAAAAAGFVVVQMTPTTSIADEYKHSERWTHAASLTVLSPPNATIIARTRRLVNRRDFNYGSLESVLKTSQFRRARAGLGTNRSREV